MRNKNILENSEAFFSDKIISREQITLIENDKIISEDSHVAQSLNFFFSSIVTNLKIPEYTDSDSSSENITDPIIKTILKYRNHPSMLPIGEPCQERSTSPFSFSEVFKEEVLRYILNLDTSKTCEDTYVPQDLSRKRHIFAEFDVSTRFTKGNAYIFAEFQHSRFNESVRNSKFPYVLKQAKVTPVFKEGEKI